MAELVDALVSGTSGSNTLEVRVFLRPPDVIGVVAHPSVQGTAEICCKSEIYWGCSSVDRALRSHRRGRGFESHQLHQYI